MENIPPPPVPPRHRPHPWIRLFRIAVVVVLMLTLLVGTIGVAGLVVASRLDVFEGYDSDVLGHALVQVSLDLAGESPRRSPDPPAGAVPICPGVPERSIPALKRGFALMRATEEGARLFDLLNDEGVCVRIDDLPFNAAYALSRQTGPGDWSESYIVVDRRLVRSGAADVLAAVMVHEATHIDRAVSGAACFLNDDCVRLANGVEIDEEIAAHTAEAEWWIEMFGSDGKRFAFRNDYGENQLSSAYLRGESAFRAYVSDYRSDPREGSE